MLNYFVDKLKSGIITFINMVTLANRDYPYHDATVCDSGSTGLTYVVGSNNLNAHGSQHKLFVSKSTLIMSTENQVVAFNDANNVGVQIVANVWYEFKSNIFQVFWVVPSANNKIYFYFEGVLPEEARTPE